jgi:TQXA domain-containing protein
MKKILAVLITLMALLGAVIPALAAGAPEEAMQKAQIYARGETVSYLVYDGTSQILTPTYYTGKDIRGAITEYPAYCLDPPKPGPNDVGTYAVDTKDYITNPKIWGIIANGYPYKTIGELGVHTQEQAYYATKMALWTYLNGWNVNLWTAANGEQAVTLAAMKQIYAAGMRTETIERPVLTVTPDKTKAETDALNPNYVSQTYTVTANMEIRSYEVFIAGTAPDGTKITDMQGKSRTVFNAGEQFKALIPASETANATGSFEIYVTGELRTGAVIYGLSYDAARQDLAVTRDPFDFQDATVTVLYSPQNTFLEIVKLAAGTDSPLAGAVFKVTDAESGGVVGVFTADSSGRVVVPLTKTGVFQVEEMTPPSGFVLDVISHKDVTVKWEQTATVTFTNEKEPSLSIRKIDAATAAGVEGAVIRVAKEGGMNFTDAVTGAGGWAYLSLPPGVYTATEISVPEPYVLDSTPQTIILEAGKSASIVLKNSKKPGLIIWKYDEDTGLPLAGAEFSVAKKGGGIIYEGITGPSGMIHIESLDPSEWYTVTELAAPSGYLKTWESKDVYLEPGKTVEIKFDNRLRPALRVMKVDSQTNEPLAGAKFHVWKTEGGTVGEYITDESGCFTIYDLDEAVYSAFEFEAPEGYLLDSGHKDIQLVWGEIKTLVFTNKARPALEILKIDEETKQPLAGAKFRISETEGGAISEYVTDESGRILITGLLDKIYAAEEIVAPSGYILEGQQKSVKLEWGTTKQIVFTNKARPKLRILKLDAVTGEPLPNAEFRVTKVEDSTVSEYITSASGEILIENLDEAVYRAEEFMPPDGYIRYDESKEIMMEWGKTKTLKFDNIRKPVAVFLKTNALTGKGIPGATFRVEYEQPGGGLLSLGSYKTGTDGRIIIPKAEPGWFVFTETLPAPGFSLLKNPVTRMYFGAGDNAYLPEFERYYIGAAGAAREQAEGAQSAADSDKASTPTLAATLAVEHSGSEYYAQGEGFNWPLNSIVIKKTHAVTGELLPGAVFELYRADEQVSGVPGTAIGRYTTDSSGVIVITGLEPGFYVVKEVQAPANFLISENSQQNGFLKADGTTVLEFSFANYPYGSLLISKTDALTGEPLAGARFKVTDAAGAVIGSANGEYVTGSQGEILIPNVKPGAVVVTELQPPTHYAIDTAPRTVQIGTDGKTYKVSFENYPYGAIIIRKMDHATHEPLGGVEFKVTDSAGAVIGTGGGVFTTDAQGIITIPNLPKNSYVVTETKTPPTHILENQTRTVAVDYGQTYTIDFYNKAKSGAQIIKIDAASKQPLKGAEFTVYKQNGEIVGHYETNGDGVIILGQLSPGWFKAVETKAPNGWLLDDTPQDFEITANQFVKLVFENKQLSSLQIRKVSETDAAPLAGAVFEVRKQNGEYVGEYTTGIDGAINIPNVSPGWFVISEKKAPAGFILDTSVRTAEVKPIVPTAVTFTNKPLSGIEILKLDAFAGAPLSGATFTVKRDTGEKIGTYKTDSAGKILVSGLPEGTFIVSETDSPDGYALDEAPKTVIVKSGKLTVVEFLNKPLSGLKIIKLSSVTRQPIEGVEFEIAKMSGEKVTGELGGYTFTTDLAGQIYVPNLADGYYIVTETRQKDGYLLDAEPKTVLLESGNPAALEVLNTPLSGLLIVKTDERTGDPLQGVVFDVTRADGQRVTGNILDGNQPNTEANSPNRTTSPNGDVSGSYTTDAQGRILINSLPAGEYNVVERKTLSGYELDTDVHAATVTPGKLTTLQLTNTQKSGLRLIKTDSITKKGIYNVEFMLFDQSGKVVGTYYTDSGGVIDFTDDLTAGRYTIRETRAAAGYYRDDTPRTAEFAPGKVTEIRWENTPEMGQIQIMKLSGDDNEVTGIPAGTPLAGAVFEAYDYKTGNLVDRFLSGADGRAVSKPLPLGRFLIKEVQSPQYYKLSDKMLDVEIEFATQIIKMEYLNYSANTGAYIKKTGPAECMPGSAIRYDIREVRNMSTVPLTDFYWRDSLPTDAVRLSKIVTGTYNQSLKYKILAATNKGDIKVIADNLSTTRNNVIDCSNASLGLRTDEYVTSITMIFGTVKAGFCQVEQPQIYAKVLTSLPGGYQFANKSDAGGRHGQAWVLANSTTVCTVYQKPEKLPRTGF